MAFIVKESKELPENEFPLDFTLRFVTLGNVSDFREVQPSKTAMSSVVAFGRLR